MQFIYESANNSGCDLSVCVCVCVCASRRVIFIRFGKLYMGRAGKVALIISLNLCPIFGILDPIFFVIYQHITNLSSLIPKTR